MIGEERGSVICKCVGFVNEQDIIKLVQETCVFPIQDPRSGYIEKTDFLLVNHVCKGERPKRNAIESEKGEHKSISQKSPFQQIVFRGMEGRVDPE